MCGIAGLFGESDRDAVSAMVGRMRHRGPNDHGVETGPGFSLGMTRLSILDLSSAGHQPMATDDGRIVIVYNGETYNFAELRKLLSDRGHRFRSNSDTEVVLRLYEEFGDDFLLRLRGIFALAIVDGRAGPGRERLLLARDPLGVKPLLYARTSQGWAFASEVKALLASGRVRREVDPESLYRLLRFGSVAQPGSALRGVQMLPPAHRLIVENGQPRRERYWHLATGRRPEFVQASAEERVDLFADLLQEVVRSQLVSDVPVGAFLSGGLDSSVLVALMARSVSTPVQTFSVGFDSDDGDVHDESDAAARTAAFLGTDHARIRVSGAEVRDAITDVARALDQPSVDGTNSYFVSRAAAGTVKVALSGTGADELLAGYPWFHNLWTRFGHRPGSASRWADRWPATGTLLSRFGRLGRRLGARWEAASFRAAYAGQYLVFADSDARAMLSPALRDAAEGSRADLERQDELADEDTLSRVTALCLRGYTGNQLLRDIDAVSMAHSLEVRVPYLDVALVEAALSLPDDAKVTPTSTPGGRYRDGVGKQILVELGRRVLPEGFDQRTKRGFELPNDAWLRGPLREAMESSLSPATVAARGWFDPDEVDATRRGFLAGRTAWPRPWLLMMTELWAREVLDAPGGGT